MPSRNQLSEQEHKDLKHVLGMSKPGEAHLLNLADEAQYRFYRKQIDESGMTPEKYPQFFKVLERTRQEHIQNGGPILLNQKASNGGLVDLNIISSAIFDAGSGLKGSSDASVNTYASAVSSINGGTNFTKLTLQIYDIGTGNRIANNDPPAVYGGGEYLPIDVKGDAAGKEGMRVIFTYSYQKGEDPPVLANVHLDLDDEADGIPTVEQPVLKQGHEANKYLKFGLGRDAAHTPPDCDYYWLEPNIDNPVVRVPLKGSQKFKSNIVPTITENDITCYMMLVNKGGGAPPIIPTTQLLSGISVSPSDPKTLLWSFPYDYDLSKDKSIQFGKATFAPDSYTILYFMVRVKTQNSGVDYVSTSVYGKKSPPWSPSSSDLPGCYAMRPFWYTWHCVAEDTLVTLAGGKTKRIDELTGGDMVLADNTGRLLQVESTVFTDANEDIIAITDRYGHTVRITEEHVVVTMDGINKAKNLIPGDILITENGEAEISSVAVETFKGRVWSVGLTLAGGADQALNDENSTFFANGILVGDSRMNMLYHELTRNSLETVLSKLPEEWHPDAINAYKELNMSEV